MERSDQVKGKQSEGNEGFRAGQGVCSCCGWLLRQRFSFTGITRRCRVMIRVHVAPDVLHCFVWDMLCKSHTRVCNLLLASCCLLCVYYAHVQAIDAQDIANTLCTSQWSEQHNISR